MKGSIIFLFMAILAGAGCGSTSDSAADAPPAGDAPPTVDAPPAPDGAADARPQVDGANECILGTGVLGICRL